jgi:hypothetical protein
MVRPLVVSNPKLTMEINGGTNGWSESHFYTSSVGLNDATLQAEALALVKARCICLDGVNAKMFAARISLDDVNRDSTQLDLSSIIPSPTRGYYSIGGPDPSVTATWAYQTVQVSWPVILKTTNPTTNPIEYLAGMPASVFQFGPFPYQDLPNTIASYLERYLSILTGSVWGALGRSFTDAPSVIASIATVLAAGATPTQFTINFAAPFPAAGFFPVGAYCRLQNATYSTPQKRLRLNGTYTVFSYVAGTGTLVVNAPRVIVAPTWNTFGTMQAADASVYQYTGWVYRPITHRKRGKPFGGGRGRR